MSQLPIISVLPQLMSALEQHAHIVLQAEPGAGKSTMFPLALLQQHVTKEKIIMLEPRRLAAKNIALFLAGQLNETVGETVGYRMKGETKVSRRTRLEIVTEGVLTRMIQSDPELNGVGLVIFDEFHERSLHTDMAFALAMDVQASLREDLSIVIMSATLDLNALKKILPDACYIQCEGRHFPIEYRYAPVGMNGHLVTEITKKIQTLMHTEDGSLLAFLPGVASIKQVMARLEDGTLPEHVAVYPLYGQLDFREQQRAIAPAAEGKRKVVLATNVAETSLTIDGVRLVVDSGFERVARFDSSSGTTKLEQVRIAQSSAAQRAGRAGRLEPGICVRMYSESELRQQASTPEAEIMHADLTSMAFELAQWGIRCCEELVWLDSPPQASMQQARRLLQRLDLLDEHNQLTQHGRAAYHLSVEPRLASMLVHATHHGNDWLNAAIAGAVIVENADPRCDDVLMNLHEWQAGRHVKKHWLHQGAVKLAATLDSSFALREVDEHKLVLLLATAYPDRIGMRRAKATSEYVLSNGHGVQLMERAQTPPAEWLVVADLMKYAAMNSQIVLAAELDMRLLRCHFPMLFSTREVVEWCDKLQKIVAENQVTCGHLIIERHKIEQPDKQKLTQALLRHVQHQGLSVLNWSPDVLAWLERVRCAIDWLPEQPWPPMDNQSLLDSVMEWLSPYLVDITSAKMLLSVPLLDALKARLGWPLNQQIDEWVPKSYCLPTGSYKTIRYKQGADPILSVRIQEVFGEKNSPSLAMGRKKVVMELLSPAMRPIQVTQDLSAFWSGSYQEVKKEMKGRYPKHVWPDDPAHHVATTKTKRQLNS